MATTRTPSCILRVHDCPDDDCAATCLRRVQSHAAYERSAAQRALKRPEKADELQFRLAGPHWPYGEDLRFAGLPAMARPGLEPGTPRFSVVGRKRSNCHGMPGIPRFSECGGCGEDVRKLRSFAVDLGTEINLSAQTAAIHKRGPSRAVRVRCRDLRRTTHEVVEPPERRPGRRHAHGDVAERHGGWVALVGETAHPPGLPGDLLSARPA
jgi:hypothetical protein